MILSQSEIKDRVRGHLHDTGGTFVPARVHPDSLSLLCNRLHDVTTECHIEASHTGVSSPRVLHRSEVSIPVGKFIPGGAVA